MEETVSSSRRELDTLSESQRELSLTLEKERSDFARDKKILEDTIVDITNAEMNSRNDQASRQSEVREQEQRAKVCLTPFTKTYPFTII